MSVDNGDRERPGRPRLVPMPGSLPARASLDELARHYGSLAAGYHEHVPRIYAELDGLNAQFLVLSTRTATREEMRKLIAEAIVEARASFETTMRDVAESVPDVDDVEKIAQGVQTKAERDELKEREREWRKLRNTIIGIVVGGIVLGLITFTAGRLVERSSAPQATQARP